MSLRSQIEITLRKDISEDTRQDVICSIIEQVPIPLPIQSFVAELKVALTHEDCFCRNVGLQILTTAFSKRSGMLNFDENSLTHFLRFFLDRLNDSDCITKSMDGVKTLLRCFPGLFSAPVCEMLLSHLSKLHVPDLIVEARLAFFDFVASFLGTKSTLEFTEKNADSVVQAFVGAMEGERDPRCLVPCFKNCAFLALKLGLFLAPESVELLFQSCKVYFPIVFSPPKDDVHKITREDLADSLHRVFRASAAILPLVVPFLLEKMGTPLLQAKIDSLTILGELFGKYIPSKSVAIEPEFLQSVCSAIRTEMLNAVVDQAEDVAVAAEGAIKLIARPLLDAVAEDVIPETAAALWKVFYDFVVQPSMESVESDLIGKMGNASARILAAVSGASVEGLDRVTSITLTKLLGMFLVSQDPKLSTAVLQMLLLFLRSVNPEDDTPRERHPLLVYLEKLESVLLSVVPEHDLNPLLMRSVECTEEGAPLATPDELEQKSLAAQSLVELIVRPKQPLMSASQRKYVVERLVGLAMIEASSAVRQQAVEGLIRIGGREGSQLVAEIAVPSLLRVISGEAPEHVVVRSLALLGELSGGIPEVFDVAIVALQEHLFDCSPDGTISFAAVAPWLMADRKNKFHSALWELLAQIVQCVGPFQTSIDACCLPTASGKVPFCEALIRSCGAVGRIDCPEQQQQMLMGNLSPISRILLQLLESCSEVCCERIKTLALRHWWAEDQEVLPESSPFQVTATIVQHSSLSALFFVIISLPASSIQIAENLGRMGWAGRLVPLITELAVYGATDAVRTTAAQAVASIFNKGKDGRQYLEVLRECIGRLKGIVAEESAPISHRCGAVITLGWIMKALASRVHYMVSSLLGYVLELLSSPNWALSISALNGVGVLMSPSFDVFGEKSRATIVPMMERRCCNETMPQLLKEDLSAPQLLALGWMCSRAPMSILDHQHQLADRLVSALEEGRKLFGRKEEGLSAATFQKMQLFGAKAVEATLVSLQRLISEKRSLVMPVLGRLVDSLLGLSTARNAFVRRTSVHFLTTLAKLPLLEVNVFFSRVTRGLCRVLDDKKRAVRAEAAKCQNIWMSLA